jgi:hypothetical protein
MMRVQISLPLPMWGCGPTDEGARLLSNSGWEVSHYDLLPDKLVLYLWPRAGGTKLTFSFHLRYGLRTRTAASVLYDYYNPDAEVDLAPADFRVESNAASESQKVASVR